MGPLGPCGSHVGWITFQALLLHIIVVFNNCRKPQGILMRGVKKSGNITVRLTVIVPPPMDMQKISIDTHLKVDFLPKLAFEG